MATQKKRGQTYFSGRSFAVLHEDAPKISSDPFFSPDRVVKPLVVRVILHDQARTDLRAAAITEEVVDLHDIPATNLHG
jgi:hypothetical protein